MKHLINTPCLLLLIIFFTFSCNDQDKYSKIEDYTGPGNFVKVKTGKMVQVSSYDTTGANNDRINIHPDEKATILDVDGPGLITRIWLTIDSRDPHFLRRILLRMYWDDEKHPSVEVPVGDFFGNGFEYKHYTSKYLGMSSGGYYCYLPMPFNKSARIEAVNETGQEIYAFYYHVNYYRLELPFEPGTGYFHARWSRNIRTNDANNYVILETEGKGSFVGCNLHAQPYDKSFWYLEGDEMVYVDGEIVPSIHGTGTEDYFTSGWYYKNGEYAAAYHGLILKDEAFKRTVAYRLHIPDAIPFQRTIKFTIEHGHGNEEIIDLSSTAYWYQVEPHKHEQIKKSSLRIPLREIIPNDCTEAETVPFNSISLLPERMDMSEFGPEWSGLEQLFLKGVKDAEFSLTLSDLYEPHYDATVYFTKAPDYGDASVIVSGKFKGKFSGYNDEIHPGGKIKIADLKTRDGKIVLNFTITGKNEHSSGYNLGIDAIKLHPVRQFIPSWNIIGPFPNERESDLLRYGLDTVYPPEQEVQLDKTFTGTDGQQINWQTIQTPENGYISLWDKVDPYEFVVCYAVTYIYSRSAESIPLLLGSDDGCKVFLNDNEIYRFLDVRIAAPDQDTVKLNLRKGWNELLLKVENNFGGYAFYARVIDRNNNLRFLPRIPVQKSLPPKRIR